MGMVLTRPDFPGVLDLADIQKGARVTVHRTAANAAADYIVTSYPFEEKGVLRVRAKSARGKSHDATELLLTDMGVIADNRGFWNEYNYTTLTT